MNPIPATLDGVKTAGARWRESFSWPMSAVAATDAVWNLPARYLSIVSAIDDTELQAIALIGRPFAPMITMIQFAAFAEAAARNGARLVGHKFLDYLAGAGEIPAPAIKASISATPAKSPKRRFWLPRRLARTASWSGLWRLPNAMLAPSGVVLNHNALLRSWLRTQGHAARNGYEADFRLAGPPVDENVLGGLDIEWLAEHVVARMLEPALLSEPMKVKLSASLTVTARQAFREAATLIKRVRASRHLPKNLYSGTGSKLLSRAVGYEVLQRGGEAVRCDHGGSAILLHLPAGTGLSELSVSSRFVTYTPAASRATGLVAGCELVRPITDCALEGHTGDASLDVGRTAFRPPRHGLRRRRVMYVSTLFYGFSQTVPPILTAPQYLDWQLRLLERLSSLPIELVRKPHPGGFHPSPSDDPGNLATTTMAPFEAAVEYADVLIYDFPATTTLAIGLCTDRPIVLIDLGTMRFSDTVSAALARRCTIIKADEDERNRPEVDRATLEVAVCEGPDRVDPSFFRALFLGEE